MINSLLTKFYNNYAIIYVQNSPKLFYIKHYNIIHTSHEQPSSCVLKLQFQPFKSFKKKKANFPNNLKTMSFFNNYFIKIILFCKFFHL